MNDTASVMMVIVGVVGSLLLIGGAVLLVFLVGGREEKSGRGLRTRPENCPVCAHPVPPAPFLVSVSEALWGGWTCTHCQAGLDRRRDDTR